MQDFDKAEEVGISFKSSKRISRSCICLVILSVLVVGLLVTSAIFVTFYVLDNRKSESKSESTKKPSLTTITTPHTNYSTSTLVSPTSRKPEEQKYCGSKACFLASIGRLMN